MEIIYKTCKAKSNFAYCSDIYKDKETLISFNHMCESVADDEFRGKDVKFDNDIEGTLYLCYPLTVVVKDSIKFNSLYTLISEIRRVYQEVYKDRKSMISCGIWGHDIYDLCIEGIEVFTDGSVDVSIGS